MLYRRLHNPALASVALIVAVALLPQYAAAGERCRDTGIVVHSATPEDADTLCAAAAAAIRFLADRGLNTNVKFEVSIVGKLPLPISAAAFGGYIHAEHRAYLLQSSEVAARQTVFGLAYDRSLYRALAVHEVAHAIAAANFTIPQPSLEAEEYIAYAAMFATMPPGQRRVILEAHPATIKSELELNAAVYMLDPFRFAVLSYRHFSGPDGGTNFLRQILAGRALPGFAF